MGPSTAAVLLGHYIVVQLSLHNVANMHVSNAQGTGEIMKYAQYLKALESDAPPEWRGKFLGYKRLKKAIKQLR